MAQQKREAGFVASLTPEYGQNNAAEKAIDNIGRQTAAGIIGALASNRTSNEAKFERNLRNTLGKDQFKLSNIERTIKRNQKISDAVTDGSLSEEAALRIQKEVPIRKLKQIRVGSGIQQYDPDSGAVLGPIESSMTPKGQFMDGFNNAQKQQAQAAKEFPSSFSSVTTSLDASFALANTNKDEITLGKLGRLQGELIGIASEVSINLRNRQQGAFLNNAEVKYETIGDITRDTANKGSKFKNFISEYSLALKSKTMAELAEDPNNELSQQSIEQMFRAFQVDIRSKWNPEIARETGISMDQLNEYFKKETATIKEFSSTIFDKSLDSTVEKSMRGMVHINEYRKLIEQNDVYRKLQVSNPALFKQLEFDQIGVGRALSNIVEAANTLGKRATVEKVFIDIISPIGRQNANMSLDILTAYIEKPSYDGVNINIVKQTIEDIQENFIMARDPSLRARFTKAYGSIIEEIKKQSKGKNQDALNALENGFKRWNKSVTKMETTINSTFGGLKLSGVK